MSWHLTVSETALFVPFGVIAGSALQYIGTRRMGTHARSLAFDQRIWDAKLLAFGEIMTRLDAFNRTFREADLSGDLMQDRCQDLLATCTTTNLLVDDYVLDPMMDLQAEVIMTAATAASEDAEERGRMEARIAIASGRLMTVMRNDLKGVRTALEPSPFKIGVARISVAPA